MSRNPAIRGEWKQVQAFLVGDGATDQYAEYARREQLLSTNTAKCFGSRGEAEPQVAWWQVIVHGLEVMRSIEAPAVAPAPLSKSEIVNLVNAEVTGGPVASTATATALAAARYSQLKARVIFNDDTLTQRVVDFDIGGGGTLSLASPNVDIYLLMPELSQVIPEGAEPPPAIPGAGTGVFVDSIIQASAAPAPCAPIGRRALKYTKTLFVPVNVSTVFEIPAGAIEVAVFSDTTAAFAGNTWSFVTGGPFAGGLKSAGQIPAALAQGGRRNSIPGTARWLVLANAAQSQTATAVFWLEY